MTEAPQAAWLPDGRLHLNHGPIDLIITADGPGRDAALQAAVKRFDSVLSEIVRELHWLTLPYEGHRFDGAIAQRMAAAVAPLAGERFVTPMAAVAGAVADEMVSVFSRHALRKANVNNGGDIAFLLTGSEELSAAAPTGPIRIPAGDPVRGLATSGWRGRSHSFGIADAVTVLAETAARADAAATLIANAVDLPGHPAIERRPAHEQEAVPQLRERLVTTAVGALSEDETETALDRGMDYGQTLVTRGLIRAAILLLNGKIRLIGSEDTAKVPLVDPS